MKMRLKRTTGILFLMLLSCAIITVNIYFPEKDVKEAYKALEKELMTPGVPAQEPKAKPEGKPGPASRFEFISSAYAQESGMDCGWFMQEVHERTQHCPVPPLVTPCTDGENGGWFRNISPKGNFWGVMYQPLLERVRRGETEVRPKPGDVRSPGRGGGRTAGAAHPPIEPASTNLNQAA